MPKYFLNAFAVDGDITAIPDAAQISGSVSYDQGWTIDYQKDLLTDPTAKPIPRDQMNQLFFDITNNLKYLQEHGVPEFITTTDHGGTPFPYAKYAFVRYDSSGVGTNYKIYQSLIDSNTNLPTDAAHWRVIDPNSESIPTGAIIDFGMAVAPAGFVLCDGSAISRTTFATLFATIGITWGAGDGSTTFNVPTLARRTRIGSGGTPSGIISNTVGSLGGAETHLQTIAEMPSHNHPPAPGMGPFLYDSGAGGVGVNSGSDTDRTHSITGDTGGGTPFNIMQPAAVVYACIKT